MQIFLRKMRIINFKGIKVLEITFDQETFIEGDNATGKTSIFDAFLWCLFGKDSCDSAKFNIKPLTTDGRSTDKTENEVTIWLSVDGRLIEIKKIFRENWVKKRGDKIAVFQGNENLYFWNDVPLQEKEFNAKVTELVPPSVFKMLTNTLYFNQQMSWQERRAVLMNIAGAISYKEIANGNPEFNALIEMLTNKNLVEYKKEIAARKKKLKEGLEHIPARIDQENRGLPEALNWASLVADIATKEAEIAHIDQSIANNTAEQKEAFDRIKEQMKVIHDLKIKRDKIAYDIKAAESRKANDQSLAIRNKRAEIDNVSAQLKSNDDAVTKLKTRKENLVNEMADLRAKWTTINANEISFDSHEFTCPTCKREFEESDIESKKTELSSNFKADKQRKLTDITNTGKAKKTEADDIDTRIAELFAETETLEEHRSSLYAEMKVLTDAQAVPSLPVETIIENNLEYRELADKIGTLESEKDEEPKVDNSRFTAQKAAIRAEIDRLKADLARKDQIERSAKRVEALQEEEKELSEQLVNLEGMEFTIERFVKAQIDAVQERINGKFKIVSFNMFNYLNNGGVEEACETTVNGVPFSSLNTASKINAGIDIINVLCAHYDIHAPVFIDNRESIVEIIPCDSQIINLVVKEGSPLTIDGMLANRQSQDIAA